MWGPEGSSDFPTSGTEWETELSGKKRTWTQSIGRKVRIYIWNRFPVLTCKSACVQTCFSLRLCPGCAIKWRRYKGQSVSWSSRGSSIMWPWTSCCCRPRALSRLWRQRDMLSQRRSGFSSHTQWYSTFIQMGPSISVVVHSKNA